MMVLVFNSESEREKFEYMYDQYRNLMLNKAYGILRDRMLAEDAVSEAFIRIYKNMRKIDDPAGGRAIAFAVTIAKNCALTLLDKRTKGAEDRLDEQERSAVNVEESVLSDISASEIMGIVDGLGEANKNIFLLKFAYGFSHGEIAKMFGETENNITVRLHRIRKRLGVKLNSAGNYYR